MRKTIFTLMGFAVCLLVSCTQEKNDLEQYQVKGNVKSIMTKYFKAVEKFGEVTLGDCRFYDDSGLVCFNTDGLITEKTSYDCDGSILTKSVYEYDSDNLLSNVTYYKVDWQHPNGSLDSKEVYQYNEKRQLVQSIRYDSNGVEILKVIYEWEGKNCVKTMTYHNELLSRVQVNEYNGNSIVKSVLTDSDGIEIKRMEYADNRLSKEVIKDYVSKSSEIKNSVPKEDIITTYRYNDKGLCCEIGDASLTLSKGKSYTFEYEYDQKGNWIKCTKKNSQTKIATIIAIREITYY